MREAWTRGARALVWGTILLGWTACRSGTPAPVAQPPTPAAPTAAPAATPPPSRPRVVLISLDGASGQDLWALHREGRFSAAGFERFFARGEVAAGLTEINPTLTAPSHISLATGYAPSQTGIVSNTFHIPGQPFFKRESGFSAPIETETLWEAARRQGLRVGVVTWPGADNTGPRRRGDWGMAYAGAPLRPARTMVLRAADFTALASPPAGAIAARRHTAQLPTPTTSPTSSSPLSSQENAADVLEVTALDRSDDGRLNFDTLALRIQSPGAGATVVLERGGWARLELPALAALAKAGEPRIPIVAYAQLVELDPELGEVVLYLGAAHRTEAYPADFAQRLASAGLAWPGAPDDRALEQSWDGKAGLDLDAWLAQTERFATYFVDAMLLGAREESWDLLMGYVPVIDEAGHQLLLADPRQEDWSAGREAEFAAARQRVWQAVDREIARLLNGLDLSTTTVVLVSDHGMAPVHAVVDPSLVLLRAGWLVLDAEGKPAPQSRATAMVSGALAHVYLNLVGREAAGTVAAADAPDALRELRDLFVGLEAGTEARSGPESDTDRPIATVLSRTEADAIGLNHAHSGDLLLRSAPGYWFSVEMNRWRRADGSFGEPVFASPALGQHGFPNEDPAMRGIFLALGAGVPPVVRSSRGLPFANALDVAPRVAGWLGIQRPRAQPTEQ